MTITGWWVRVFAAGALMTALVSCADASSPDDGDAGAATNAPGATGAVPPADAPSSGTSPVSSPESGPSAGRQPEGFSTIRAEITDAGGEVCEVCLWLADDAAERARGLMDVTDLGGADGMVFVFDEAIRGSFYMFQTPTPLSIAWFSPDGVHVGSADMEPCLDTAPGDCELYSPDAAYELAIEVFEGGLDALGIGPGSRVELMAGSEADRCAESR